MIMIDFEGIDELIAEVEAMNQDVGRLKKEALEAGGDLLAERWREDLYSYGINARTGKAADSIRRGPVRNGEVFVGPTSDGFYLYMLEYGFYNVQARRFIAPRPTASIIYERSKGDILGEYAKVFRGGLRLT